MSIQKSHTPAPARRHEHVAHFYADDERLGERVAAWLAPALARDGGAILACTLPHADLVRVALAKRGIDAAALERDGRLAVLEADALMRRFFVHGAPAGPSFQRLARVIVQSVRDACPAPGAARVRAWGEMVNVLWERGERGAVEDLEALWNLAVEETGIELLCSYRVDDPARATSDPALAAVRALHASTHAEDEEASGC